MYYYMMNLIIITSSLAFLLQGSILVCTTLSTVNVSAFTFTVQPHTQRLNSSNTPFESTRSVRKPRSIFTRQATQSSSSSSSNSLLNNDNSNKKNNNNKNNNTGRDMPWSTHQEWALQDKISNYIIHIPQKLNNPTLVGGGVDQTTFCLWYTLRKDVTELMGYDVSYLQQKYQTLQEYDDDTSTSSSCSTTTDDHNDENNRIPSPPGILPYMDEFEFRTNGGIKGRIYGLVGIEPGTEIVTSPLKDVEMTLPKGFVLTMDGSCAYELGIPKAFEPVKNKLADYYKNKDIIEGEGRSGESGGMKTNNDYFMDLSALTENGSKIASSVGKQSKDVAGNVVNELTDPETSQMIVNLGTTTAIALGAATAMNMLSHHLTVNVFWV